MPVSEPAVKAHKNDQIKEWSPFCPVLAWYMG